MRQKKTETISIKVSNNTLQIIRKLAEEDDRTLSYIANKMIEEWINRNIQEQTSDSRQNS